MQYYIIYNGRQYGPMEKTALRQYGLNADSKVWHAGLADWVSASHVEDLKGMFPPRLPGMTPSQPAGEPIGNGRQYAGDMHDVYRHSNWLPWSIVATVLGFLLGCMGGILGIVAIVNSNKANSCYDCGMYREAQSANSVAKTCVIIALVLAALGLLSTISALSDAIVTLSASDFYNGI